MDTKCPEVRLPCADNCPKAGYAFVPVQVVTRYYDHQSALSSGTIFPELSIPKGQYGPKEDANK